MKRCILIICILASAVLSLGAQQMQVERFVRVRHGLLTHRTAETDKKQALIDFYTNEKGFTFQPDGRDAVSAEEAEGRISLPMPDGTTYIVISHPDYGQLTWKVPGKPLRRKRHYEAELLTFSPDKEFRFGSQWAVFYVEPENALVTVDTLLNVVRTGSLQLLLPLGRHSYRVEAPFYETCQDTIELKDDDRLEARVRLTPVYSYLKVNAAIPEAEVRLDGELAGTVNATSKRIMAGTYRLTVTKGNLCYYNDTIAVKPAEKRVVDLTPESLLPQRMERPLQAEKEQTYVIPQEKGGEEINAPVHIKAFDDSTEIWINREPVGKGSWDGTLGAGFYAISSLKDSLESDMHYLWVEDSRPQNVSLSSPAADYGMLNLSCNEVDATVLLNDRMAGRTPCVIKNLPVGRTYVIRLRKQGFREAVSKVLLRGNDMMSVKMILKR